MPGPAATLPSTAGRLLVVRLSHLGDVVCGLPAWHALRRARPEARLGWVVQAEFAPLLQVLPALELLRFGRSGRLGAWRTLRRGVQAVDNAMNIWHIDTLEHGVSLGVNPNFYFHMVFERAMEQNSRGVGVEPESREAQDAHLGGI